MFCLWSLQRQVELAHRGVRQNNLKSDRVVTEADYERALRAELSADNSLNTLKGSVVSLPSVFV